MDAQRFNYRAKIYTGTGYQVGSTESRFPSTQLMARLVDASRLGVIFRLRKGSLNKAVVCQSTMTVLLEEAALLVNKAVAALVRVWDSLSNTVAS